MNSREYLLKAASILDEVIEIAEASASKSASDTETSEFNLSPDMIQSLLGQSFDIPNANELAANILENQPQKSASFGSPNTYDSMENIVDRNSFDDRYLYGGNS